MHAHEHNISRSLGRVAAADRVGTQFVAQARNSAPLIFKFRRSRVEDSTILRWYQIAISSLVGDSIDAHRP